jgi:hypothetical protein
MCLSDRADRGQADSVQAERAGLVELLDVTDNVLEELLEVALTDAAPDDVTRPEDVGNLLRRSGCRVHPTRASSTGA